MKLILSEVASSVLDMTLAPGLVESSQKKSDMRDTKHIFGPILDVLLGY